MVESVRDDSLDDQKLGYDRVRRDRRKAFDHLYQQLDGVSRNTCFYCNKTRANTLDHCPSLLMVDALGVAYFQQRGIPFVLIPACSSCNIDIGTGHVLLEGHTTHIDLRHEMWRSRKNVKRRQDG